MADVVPPPPPLLPPPPGESSATSEPEWDVETRPLVSVVHFRAIVAAVVLIFGIGATFIVLTNRGAGGSPTPQATPNAGVEQAFASTPATLPAATAPPAPAPPALAAAPPLQTHEIFGFAPWWNLGGEGALNVKSMTTIAYFSVDVTPDGSVDQSDSGWNGYQSQALADLVTRAHEAGDRVVLTATCFGQSALDKLTSDPSAPSRLGTTLVQLVQAKNLDGVNFDFEGQGPGDRAGLDNLVARASDQLRAANPHWQVSMSTYASSAGDPNGFFDIGGLNRSVDAFFVMAYDMDDPSVPSATSPLVGPGNNVETDLAEYASVVPTSKVILGVPYYGYDWPTSGPQSGSAATGTPAPVTYAQVAASNLPWYWDPHTDTPWTEYQSGSQWHQVWIDNPTSLALKARLANADHLAGLGIWALGMDGNAPAMLAALLGNAPAAKYQTGPSASSPGGASTSYGYSGVYQGIAETLTPVDPSTFPGGGRARTAGTLSSFSTNNPADACLAHSGSLPVYELTAAPTTYVVQVTTPTYCASGTWEFSAPAQGPPSSSTATTPTTTTTTMPPLLGL